MIFALNSGTIPVRVQKVIEEVEGVEAVTPILAKFLGDQFHIVFGSILKVSVGSIPPEFC